MGLFKKSSGARADKDYDQKSDRIYAWSSLLRAVSKFLWLIVMVIVLAALGKMFIFKTDKGPKEPKPIEKTVVQQVDWDKVNRDIRGMMIEARLETELIAVKKLDAWIARNMKRVDEDFLDWYFGYWTQQKLGLKALLSQVWHWVDSDSPTAAEKVTQIVQEEFTNRVIRPQIAQMEMERIINEIVAYYSATLKGKLAKIPTEYKINPVDWDRYISDISIMVRNVEGNRSTSLPMKALVGLTAGGTLVVFRSLKPIVIKIGSKFSSKMAASAASKMAAKTGGKVAAKSGGKFLGSVIAIGIIIWDVWDHHATKKKAKPVLRKNIHDYFQEMKRNILHDPEYGIMTVIYQMELSIASNVKKTQPGPTPAKQ